MTLDEVIAETRGRPCSLSDDGDAVIISHEGGAKSVSIRMDAITPEVIQSVLFALDANAYPERFKRFMAASKRLMETYA